MVKSVSRQPFRLVAATRRHVKTYDKARDCSQQRIKLLGRALVRFEHVGVRDGLGWRRAVRLRDGHSGRRRGANKPGIQDGLWAFFAVIKKLGSKKKKKNRGAGGK